MGTNTHGTISHCESMLATRPIIFGYLFGRRSARLADRLMKNKTDGTDSDHPAARGSLWRRVWVLPRRLLPSRRTCRDRRHTRVGPGRPGDRVAGARAHRWPLSLIRYV